MNRYKEYLFFSAEGELWNYYCGIHEAEDLYEQGEYHARKEEFVCLVGELERHINVYLEFFGIRARPQKFQQSLPQIEEVLQAGDSERWERISRELWDEHWKLLGELRKAMYSHDEPDDDDFEKYAKIAEAAKDYLYSHDFSSVVFEGKRYRFNEQQTKTFGQLWRRNDDDRKADIQKFLIDIAK